SGPRPEDRKRSAALRAASRPSGAEIPSSKKSTKRREDDTDVTALWVACAGEEGTAVSRYSIEAIGLLRPSTSRTKSSDVRSGIGRPSAPVTYVSIRTSSEVTRSIGARGGAGSRGESRTPPPAGQTGKA